MDEKAEIERENKEATDKATLYWLAGIGLVGLALGIAVGLNTDPPNGIPIGITRCC